MSKYTAYIMLLLFQFQIIELLAYSYQDSITTSRPKIGLVLSGGGAKGFAHIGVLKVLEEQGIRPDYITGTSMGSIVAGLYSLGYSADQLETIISEADWNDILSDKITLKDIPIFEKDNYPGYPLQLSINEKGKLSLPSGMIKGQKIHSTLSKLVWSSHQYPVFDSLPIPFRCVATDIISGQAIVFENGNLADAMRASMSIPTVFTPIVTDTMMLIDGGVVKNFPVQECFDMGADIVIGVYTGFEENPKSEDLKSMVKILARSSAFQGIVDATVQAKKTDLLIVPDLKRFGAENFNKAKEIILAGEISARDSDIIQKMREIALISNKKIIEIIVDTGSVMIDRIVVKGSNRIDSATIIKMSRLKSNTSNNASEIEKGIGRIYSSWLFDKVTYDIDNSTSENTLVLQVEERTRGIMDIGLHYDNSYGPNALFKIYYNDLFIKSTRADMDVSLSLNPQVRFNYNFYPTKRRRLELSLNAYLQVNKMPDIITQDSMTFSLGHYLYSHADFNVGISWSPIRNTMLQVIAGRQLNKVKLKEGMEIFYNTKEVNYNMNFTEFRLSIVTLDDPFFPTKGTYFKMITKYSYGAESDKSDSTAFLGNLSSSNSTFTIDFKYYFRIKKRFSIIPEMTLGFMEGKAFLTEKFFLGGFTYNNRPNVYNCAGIRSNYIATDNFAIMGIGVQYKLLSNWYFQLSTHGLVFADYAEFDSESEVEFEDNSFGGWSAGVGYQSNFGPMRFIISKSPERKEYVWSVNIGVPF
jgi:NTE family protein